MLYVGAFDDVGHDAEADSGRLRLFPASPHPLQQRLGLTERGVLLVLVTKEPMYVELWHVKRCD